MQGTLLVVLLSLFQRAFLEQENFPTIKSRYPTEQSSTLYHSFSRYETDFTLVNGDLEEQDDSFISRANLMDFSGNAALSKLVYTLDLGRKEAFLGKTITEASPNFVPSFESFLSALLELYGDYTIVEALTRNENEFSGLILEHKSHIVICYAGTKSLADWSGNFNAFEDEYSQFVDEDIQVEDDYVLLTQKQSTQEKVYGHAGFLNNYRQSKSALDRVFSRHKDNPTLRITTTGHSLGGVLALNATIYALKFFPCPASSHAKVTLDHISFCAPPALSPKAAEFLAQQVPMGNIIRVFNPADAVPKAGLYQKYVHVGLPAPYTLEGVSLFSVKENHSLGKLFHLLQDSGKKESRRKHMLEHSNTESDDYCIVEYNSSTLRDCSKSMEFLSA